MTVAYRLCSSRYPANSGEGARLYGGRWNFAWVEAIYAANPSLAALEVLAHFSVLPQDYTLTEIKIPDEIIEFVPDDQLPASWDEEPWPLSASETAAHNKAIECAQLATAYKGFANAGAAGLISPKQQLLP